MAEKAFADTASPSPKRRGPSPTYFNKKPVTEDKVKPKKKKTVNRRQITDFFTDYLKDNYSFGEDIKKPTIKFLGGNSKSLYKKWSLHNPAMFYFSTQVISLDDKEASGRNKVASLILQKAGHLSEDMCLVGPCVVANNWF